MVREQATGEDGPPRCRVGVVIINYRTPDLTRQCVESVAGSLEAADARIALVDNFSDDGSAEALQDWLDRDLADKSWRARIHFVKSPTNTGFSGGNNLGFRALDADYYLLLNSDAYLRDGALQRLVSVFEAEDRVGAVGPRLEDPDSAAQVSCFRFFHPFSELIDGARTGVVSKLFSSFQIAQPLSDQRADYDWVSFACIMISRAAYEAAGPMDEGYFMYFEDADYCRALRAAGFRTVYAPEARAVHLRGGSSPVKKMHAALKRPPAYYYASRARYFRKHFGVLGLVSANLLWLLGRVVAHARRLLGHRAPPVCEKQARDIWINWRDPLGGASRPVS